MIVIMNLIEKLELLVLKLLRRVNYHDYDDKSYCVYNS